MSNLISCPDCGHQISSKAKTCPKCGRLMSGISISTIASRIAGITIVSLIAIGWLGLELNRPTGFETLSKSAKDASQSLQELQK